MSNLPATAKPWDQLPDETDTAYHRFSIYLKMGPERTLDRVRKEVGKKSGYQRQLERWSSKYNWVKRASLFDGHIIRKSLEVRQDIIDEVNGKLLMAASRMADELIRVAEHSGPESIDPQKVRAIESILDRVGVVKKKDMPDLSPGEKVQNFYQQINQTIINQRGHAGD